MSYEPLTKKKNREATTPSCSKKASASSVGTYTPTQGSSGAPLSPDLQARARTTFGSDLSGVRVHTDESASRSAAHLSANAFTIGRDIYFDRNAYQPSRPEGMRLLGHELAHVVQQHDGSRDRAELASNPSPHENAADEAARAFVARAPAKVARTVSIPTAGRSADQAFPDQPGRPTVQREMRFDSNAATAKAKVVGGGKPDRMSDALFDTFIAGLEKHLGLTCNIVPDTYDIASVSDSSGADKVRQKILDTYGNDGLELQAALGGFATIDGKTAVSIWEDVRNAVRKQIKGGVDVFNDPSIDGPAVADMKRIVDGDIRINPKAIADTYFRFDSGWDLFWVVLHEMLHIDGFDDAKDVRKGHAGYVPYKSEERSVNMMGEAERKTVTVPGDVVYRLNVIRAGLELPVRTNYSDSSPSESKQSAIFFADKPGRNQVEYVGGMIVSPNADKEQKKMLTKDLYLEKTGIPSAAERHRRKGREKGKEFSPGFKVLGFGFRNGDVHYAPPFAISLGVSDSGEVELIGDYSYTHEGMGRRGVLCCGEFVSNGLTLGLQFAWQEYDASGKSDWGRSGSATVNIEIDSSEYKDLYWLRGRAKLEGEWVTDDDAKLAGNVMSLIIERIPPPPPE